MQTIKATYRIVSPMFIGGADQSPSDGIRPPSFKGALRFWWRALNWSEYPDLAKLHKAEADLFGSAAKDNKGGQGKFLISMVTQSLAKTDKGALHGKFKSADGARYLAYGLMGAFGANAGKLERGCINDCQTFTVRLAFRKEIDDSIIDALVVLGLLGGMGSRSRKGLGSLALLSLKGTYEKTNAVDLFKAPSTEAEYIQEIKNRMAGLNRSGAKASFSAFSKSSSINLLVRRQKTVMEVLDKYGRAMMMYRSWGNNGRVLGMSREENFKDDHDWSKGSMPQGFHPRRVIFGLPHNYGKGPNLSVEPEKHRRRSSPLFYHVHQIGNEFFGVSMILPAQFLPEDEKINAGGNKVPAKIEWEVLDHFITGKDKGGAPRFPKQESIKGDLK